MKLIAGVVVLVVLVLVFGGGFLPTQGTGNTEIDGVLKEKGIQYEAEACDSDQQQVDKFSNDGLDNLTV